MTMQLADSPANGSGNGEQVVARRGVVVDAGDFANLLDTNRFDHLWRIACLFSKSELVPEHYRGKTENCFIACQMAMRMGVDPFMFMQNTHIIHGKPGMEAKLAIALINSSGLFVDSLDYEIVGDDPTAPAYRVRAFAERKTTGKRVNGPWLDWKTVKAEGWDSKGGSKWKTMPGLMFQYRAATWFGRLHCPERLMGMQTADEVHDAATATGEPTMPVITQRGIDGLKNKLTNRPVSENQEFEPAPEALEQAAREAAGKPLPTEAEAEKILREKSQSAQGEAKEPDVGPRTQENPEQEESGLVTIDTWEAALIEAAIDGEVAEPQMREYVKAQVKLLTKHNRADSLTDKQRTAIVTAIRGGLK